MTGGALRHVLGTPRLSLRNIPGLIFWLDAADANTYALGTGVSNWYDKSGSNAHASQATGGSQPLYIGAGRNGRNVIRFDGTDDLMTTATLNAAHVQPCTYLIAGIYNNSGAVFFFDGDGVSNRHAMGSDFNVTVTPGGFAGATLEGTGDKQDDWHIFSAVFNGVSSQLWVDGVLLAGPADVGVQNPISSLTIASRYSIANFLNGDIGELLCFSGTLSTPDRRNVESYLGNKWGVVV